MNGFFENDWHIDIQNKTSLTLFMSLKSEIEISNYLIKIYYSSYRNCLAKIRLSSHQLNIEVGRHRNIDRLNKICTLCNMNEIEDEYHFILICPFYKNLRENYIKRYFFIWPSTYKLTQLLENSNVQTLNNLAFFCIKASEQRREALNSNN